jgi:protein-tyrosine phosphatase
MINTIAQNLFQGDLEGVVLGVHFFKPKINVIVYLGMDCSVDLSKLFTTIPVVHIPLLDSAGNSDEQIETAIDVVTDLIGHNKNVLVCCVAGMSRSSMVCLAYLVRSGYWFDDAEKTLRKTNPRFMPEPDLYAQFKKILD